jgi:CRISPR/Cas system-associated exonuclease Cas4 (RecB family)
MKSFLEYVAEDIINKYGTNLSDIAIVFPNKRASLFLNEHLARLSGKPLWSPTYITISDLFRQHATLTVADPIKLVCDLHKSFCQQTGSQETLDKFYGWGQLLLSDFDDIDKNMADADRVFANLRDIHELDDISYLTDEQREMIRRFFSNFSEDHNTELKERFLRLWSHFADIYHDFNERLAAQGLAYEGALYRQVVESFHPSPTTSSSGLYLFVGFNLIQKVEQQLFTILRQEGKAKFYWDFDNYYMEKHHEAGQFIAQYQQDFPNELSSIQTDIYDNFRKPKSIEYISAPTENLQARFVSTWLRTNQRYQDGRRTAIVLCQEGLLQTVIHCLPPEVDKVNVTTGYPLSQTPVASLLQQLINLQVSNFMPRHLRSIRRHAYTRYIDEDTLTERLSPLTPESLLDWLIRILRQIATNSKETISDPLFQESLFRTYTLLNRLAGLVEEKDLTVDTNTMTRLIGQLTQQATIPFHGEPAEGVQVMGILETRNLDFDHVLLLSCNEGNMPRGVNDSSFIPHGIRHAYELTTVENKVSIYAYYFYRLLQRAQDITILWNSSTEDGQRGEMSRFMLQLMVESSHSITQHILQSGHTLSQQQPATVEKTQRVMEILTGQESPLTTLLSPTAINRYMRCPLQFYYRYVADIKEPNVPDDEQELDSRIFGNIFHEAADIIYKQLPKRITKDILEHLLKTKVEIERAVDEAFRKEMPMLTAHAATQKTDGLHIINREVIIHYLRQLILTDIRLTPFTILGLEYDVKRNIPFADLPYILSMGGRIDRLDLVGEGTPEEHIRVVDYKTGSSRLKALADVDAIFEPENIHEHSDYYLQTFIYADIVSKDYSSLLIPHSSSPRVTPALIFIQHAAADDYDPTLCFGQQKITDIADYSTHFNELLEAKVNEIFSKDIPFTPTKDLKTCQSCPYALLCRH